MPLSLTSVLRVRIVIGIALLLVHCGSAAQREAPVVRFVDAAHRVGAESLPGSFRTTASGLPGSGALSTAALPTATIDDDTRFVLSAPARGVLASGRVVRISEPGVLSLRLRLGQVLASADRVVLLARVIVADGGRVDASAQVAAVEGQGGSRHVRLQIRSPLLLPGAEVKLFVEAIRAAGAGGTSYRTPEVRVPAGAALEFSWGELEAARGQGPLRFSIAACQASRCEPLFEQVSDSANPAGWRERRIPLHGLAGESVEFLFEARAEDEAAGAVHLPVWANPTIVAPGGGHGPNVILFSIDTLRADHLSAYGYRRRTDPFLAGRFAAQGVLFENLRAQATTTDPSHMTLFTSLPPSVHGVTRGLNRLAVPVVTLAEAFRAEGFGTAAFTENGPLARGRGFGLGFERYVENKSAHFLRPEGQVVRTFAELRDWLEGHDSRRFFAFVHTFQVHAPYEPPARYLPLFAKASGAGPAAAQAQLVASYDREIRFVDDQLRLLFEWLEQRGRIADTILVLLSDHGEEFFEHGSQGHGGLPFDELLRVPLIFHGPGVPAGRRVAATVDHLGVMPTILDLAGVTPVAGLQGSGFSALVRGRERSQDSPPRAFVSYAFGHADRYDLPSVSLLLGSLKLTRYSLRGREHFQYFDLDADPGETTNLYGDGTGEGERLRRRLEAYESEMASLRRALESRRAGSRAAPLPLDPDREQKLRALGYIE